jgi:hypothetical protein
MIDLSMAKGNPTYEMDSFSYPPDAARVRVCVSMLAGNQVNEASTKHLLKEWEEYAQKFTDSQLYRDACSEKLLLELGRITFSSLVTEMPNLPKIVNPPPDVQAVFAHTTNISFEDAIQHGCAVLAWRYDNFESWWQDVRTRLV